MQEQLNSTPDTNKDSQLLSSDEAAGQPLSETEAVAAVLRGEVPAPLTSDAVLRLGAVGTSLLARW